MEAGDRGVAVTIGRMLKEVCFLPQPWLVMWDRPASGKRGGGHFQRTGSRGSTQGRGDLNLPGAPWTPRLQDKHGPGQSRKLSLSRGQAGPGPSLVTALSSHISSRTCPACLQSDHTAPGWRNSGWRRAKPAHDNMHARADSHMTHVFTCMPTHVRAHSHVHTQTWTQTRVHS